VSRHDRLLALQRAFTIHRERPFPKSSDDDEASELHDELAEYDTFIAGLVSTILNNGDISAYHLEVDADLKARIEKVIEEGRAEAAGDAKQYLEYLAQLEKLVELAKACI
jgi:predicted house-cleaning noncanonical NTP pyrophosphatase (MazG superfamily)